MCAAGSDITVDQGEYRDGFSQIDRMHEIATI